MTDSFNDILRLYEYRIPPELIAQAPASPRDSAKLLAYDRISGTVTDAAFRDIGDFLPEGCVLVLNETKVVPAKLLLTRATGGSVSALSLGIRSDGVMRAYANRKLRPGEFLRMEGERGFIVEGSDDPTSLASGELRRAGKEWLLRPSFPIAELQQMLERHGHMPLPPYIKHTPLSPEELRREYQTVFAANPGSIAAPTASLHFTDALLDQLQKRGVTIVKVTLHVHLGTFAPLTEEQWAAGRLHTEEYVISSDSASVLTKAKKDGRKIVAVGTTVVRTLESAFALASADKSAADGQGGITRLSGTTDLFIKEGYPFKVVDALITNFHVPKSSLLMLVSAFAGREKILELYRHAIERRYRFFSFGDAMIIT